MPNTQSVEALPETPDAQALTEAMRPVAGAVAVVTAGEGADRTVSTATSAVSLSTEPPRMLFCVNRTASARLATDALDEALIAVDCAVEETIERHSHAIVIGRLRALRLGTPPGASALLYAQGRLLALDLA